MISIVQGASSGKGFKKGYQSFVTDSRTPFDALSDMTNVTLDQDNLPRPRPSLVLHGTQPLGPVIGADTFIKIVSGLPEKWDITMQVIGSYGKIHVRKDGGDWTAVTGNYDKDAIATFCQSGNRVYISNAKDKMSYYNINTGAIVAYSALATPSAPTAIETGLTGTNFTYYYRISANNAVGESAASTAGSAQVSTIRDSWASATQYITVSWSAVASATSYSIYVSSVSGQEKYLATVAGLTFKDDGTVPVNPSKYYPQGNSTDGPVLAYMCNKDGQLYGVGDINNPDYLWYDGGSGATGDFSSFNGGGNVSINPGGSTVPQAVKAFRTGKGDTALTILSSGVGGIGKMHHLVFSTVDFDGTPIAIPNVTEIGGQSGTTSARAVVESNNSLWYPTGQDFKSTGTAANVQNILSTGSVSVDITPDVEKLNLSAMSKACGLAFENKIYWALPVSSTENNQIWVKDLSRGGIWIMPWLINAKFMWISEDNTIGQVSMCICDGTNIFKLSRSVSTQDNGVAFRTRVAHDGLVFDDSGVGMGAIEEQRFKFLYPKGEITVNASGLDEDGAVNTLATDAFTQTSSPTGWSQILWSDGSQWSDDVGAIDYTTQAVHVTNLEIDETLNQLAWEVTTDKADCDYFLSSVFTKGILLNNSYYGD
jgi:hypothetical protein